MSNIFLVSSGIHGKNGMSGQLTTQQRLEQTYDTAKSIRDRVDDCKIYLLEGGSDPLTFKEREDLLEYYDDILDFTQHEFIKFAHSKVDIASQGITVIKGPCESYKLREACRLLDTTADDRVFKISGRYRLSDKFDLKAHRAATGKFVFRKYEGLPYYNDPTKPTYSPFQYSTRMYSFCGSMLAKATQYYDTINNRLLNLYSANLYLDLEHTTFLTIDPEDVVVFDTTGLTGAFAENPDWKIDE